MSWNGFIILLLSILTQLITFIRSPCTLNEHFSKDSLTDDEDIKFCEDHLCKRGKFDYFSPGQVFEGCSFHGNPRRFLNLYKLSKRYTPSVAFNKRTCLWNGDFSANCYGKIANSLNIPSNIRTNSYDYYLLECSTKFREVPLYIPSTKSSHVQIQGISTYDVQNKNISAHPTKLFTCISACKETTVKFTTKDSNIQCTKNTCRVSSFSMLSRLYCSDLVLWIYPDTSFLYNIYVHGMFADNFFKNITINKQRREFDAGEKLSCQVKNNTEAHDISGFRINVDTKFSSSDLNERHIPIDTATLIYIICYFGVSAKRDEYSYYNIQTFRVRIRSKKLTKIIGLYNNVIVENKASNNESYKFYPSTELKCDSAYYNYSNPLIQVYQTNYISMPLSRSFCGYQSRCRVITRPVNRWTTYFSFYAFFLKCHYGAVAASTPIILYILEKATFKFVYYYPDFETDYFLPGFIFGCVGKHVDKVSLKCVNCKPAEELNLFITNVSAVILQIPKKYNFNIILSFVCTISLVDGSKDKKYKNVTIINSYFINLDNTHIFYTMNDTVHCRAEITVNSSKGSKILMPLWLKTNNKIYKNSKIPYILNRTHGVYYSYCCAILDESFKLGFSDMNNMTKCDNYFPLLVVRNFRVEYNLDLERVFPGSILKCYFCVNYTNSVELVSICKGKNRIRGKLNLVITEPDNNVLFLKNIDEFKIPLGKLKPDNVSYYNIFDYVFSVNCRISSTRTTPVMKIIVKTCERHPPKIFVSPHDHSLLVLGDVITCSTRSELCLHKLKFIISVRVNNGPPIFLPNQVSFELTRQFLGSNVLVYCQTGSVRPVSATRSYRVEGKPTNISIIYDSLSQTQRTVLLMYGDSLICTAAAFPEIHVQWIQNKGLSKLKISESRILIGPYDFNGNYKLTCIASNSRGTLQITAEFDIFNPRSNHDMDDGYLLKILLPFFTFIYVVILSVSLTFIFNEIIENYRYYQSLMPKEK